MLLSIFLFILKNSAQKYHFFLKYANFLYFFCKILLAALSNHIFLLPLHAKFIKIENTMAFFGLFGKEKKETLDKGLEKTKESVLSKISRAIAGKSTVDDDVLDNVNLRLRRIESMMSEQN